MQICTTLVMVVVVIGLSLTWLIFVPNRIKQYIAKQEGRVDEIKFIGFSTEINPKGDTLYAVHYYDKDGNEHRADIVLNIFLGVRTLRDRITPPPHQCLFIKRLYA